MSQTPNPKYRDVAQKHIWRRAYVTIPGTKGKVQDHVIVLRRLRCDARLVTPVLTFQPFWILGKHVHYEYR